MAEDQRSPSEGEAAAQARCQRPDRGHPVFRCESYGGSSPLPATRCENGPVSCGNAPRGVLSVGGHRNPCGSLDLGWTRPRRRATCSRRAPTRRRGFGDSGLLVSDRGSLHEAPASPLGAVHWGSCSDLRGVGCGSTGPTRSRRSRRRTVPVSRTSRRLSLDGRGIQASKCAEDAVVSEVVGLTVSCSTLGRVSETIRATP